MHDKQCVSCTTSSAFIHGNQCVSCDKHGDSCTTSSAFPLHHTQCAPCTTNNALHARQAVRFMPQTPRFNARSQCVSHARRAVRFMHASSAFHAQVRFMHAISAFHARKAVRFMPGTHGVFCTTSAHFMLLSTVPLWADFVVGGSSWALRWWLLRPLAQMKLHCKLAAFSSSPISLFLELQVIAIPSPSQLAPFVGPAAFSDF